MCNLKYVRGCVCALNKFPDNLCTGENECECPICYKFKAFSTLTYTHTNGFYVLFEISTKGEKNRRNLKKMERKKTVSKMSLFNEISSSLSAHSLML